ncbi:MAG: hypothetical protein JSV86_12560 [Gemmatimonadota bacterium]|nr:MAG: hypothetical protein JSV86_12560 [Gemmatimonadota bacterium]
MHPDEAASQLREELEDALADLAEGRVEGPVRAVLPPPDLGPDTSFSVELSTGSQLTRVSLPTGLAMAYLADEEAAVDEWKCWVAALRERVMMGGVG